MAYRAQGWAPSPLLVHTVLLTPHAHLILFHSSCSFWSWALSTFPHLCLASSSSFCSLNPVYSSIMNFNVNSLGMLSQTCLSCISTSPSPGFRAMLFFVFLDTVIIWHLFVWSLGYVCFASGLWAPWGQEAHLLLQSVPNIWNVVGAHGLLIG